MARRGGARICIQAYASPEAARGLGKGFRCVGDFIVIHRMVRPEHDGGGNDGGGGVPAHILQFRRAQTG